MFNTFYSPLSERNALTKNLSLIICLTEVHYFPFPWLKRIILVNNSHCFFFRLWRRGIRAARRSRSSGRQRRRSARSCPGRARLSEKFRTRKLGSGKRSGSTPSIWIEMASFRTFAFYRQENCCCEELKRKTKFLCWKITKKKDVNLTCWRIQVLL